MSITKLSKLSCWVVYNYFFSVSNAKFYFKCLKGYNNMNLLEYRKPTTNIIQVNLN